MNRLTENRIVLIVRPTRLDDLITRFNTQSHACFYIEHLGADFSEYKDEDAVYKRSVARAHDLLDEIGRVHVLDRSFISNFIFGKDDTIVILGQDGLVANTLKYLDGQPVLGVNPDPARLEGVLLPFGVEDLPRVLPEVFDRQRPLRRVSMARITLNTGQVLHGVNDLFIGPQTHTSIRYSMSFDSKTELQSSSGIIVSTGMGSTGWFRSILAGACGIAAGATGKTLARYKPHTIDWDSDFLFFSVREPWPSKTTSAQIAFGKITPTTPLRITSHMPERGVIFSDGIERDFLEFNSGTLATVDLAEKKGCLVG